MIPIGDECWKNKHELSNFLQLPESVQEQKIAYLLKNPDAFDAFFKNTFCFVYAVVYFPNPLVVKLMQQFLTQARQFNRLVDDLQSLVFILRHFPNPYAKYVIFYLFQNEKEFNRLIPNAIALCDLINCSPSEFVDEFMSFVLHNRRQLYRLVSDVETLTFVLCCFPNQYTQFIWEELFKDPQFFDGIFNHPNAFISAMNLFSKECVKKIIQEANSTLQLEVRTEVVKNYPDFIPLLLEIGIDPYLPHVSLQIDQSNFCEYPDLLHIILFYQADRIDHYIPLALSLGVDPNPKYSAHEPIAKSLLECTKQFTLPIIQTVLALIQHGAAPSYQSSDKKNILQIIYESYPSIRDTVRSFGIPERELEDSEYVLKRINIPVLRLEMQRLSQVHQARNAFINFLILLVMVKQNINSLSPFKDVPFEILSHIISFLDFSIMDKTMQEGLRLAEHFFSESQQLKSMLASPGGVSVFQDKNQFVLFKSAKILYQDYARLQRVANDQSIDNHFKEKHGLPGLESHLALYKKPSSRLLLLENVNHFKL